MGASGGLVTSGTEAAGNSRWGSLGPDTGVPSPVISFTRLCETWLSKGWLSASLAWSEAQNLLRHGWPRPNTFVAGLKPIGSGPEQEALLCRPPPFVRDTSGPEPPHPNNPCLAQWVPWAGKRPAGTQGGWHVQAGWAALEQQMGWLGRAGREREVLVLGVPRVAPPPGRTQGLTLECRK